jgi:hypothetical protein
MTRAYNTATTQQNSGGVLNPFTTGKNKIINGDFGVWQRGTSISLTSGNQVYSADRWLVTSVFSAGSSTFSQQTFTPGTAPVAGYESQYFGRITCGSTATNFNLYQRIEDVRTFAGQTVTFSFWAKSSATPQLQVYLSQSFGSGGSSNVDYYSGAVVLTNTWTRYTKTVSLSSLAGKTIGTSSNLTVGFYYDSGTINSATIDVWGFQIETGSVATPFQTATGTLQGELAACQRYFANVVPSTADYGTVISMFQAVSGSAAKGGIRFPVPMRVSASITLANANNFTLTNSAYTPIGGSSFTYAVGNTVDCRIDMSVASGLTAGNATALSGNTANLLIQASAEL